ncbi:DUF4339 domain-containing protein [Terrimonas alba]|uniref:DUF4339 domain-containing protein n=1 Tax=Terrimonas alba TaxID=3349636 RepID=UPI0035F3F386
MTNYFIKTDKGHYGPVTGQLLRKLRIKRNTLLWYNDSASWQKAEDIEELKDCFKNTPPLLATDSPATFRHAYLRNKVFGLLLAKFSKPSLLISVSLTVVIAVFLWLRFQPNKFGEDEAVKIHRYFNSQQINYQIQQKAEQSKIREQQEYERLHPEIREEREKFMRDNNINDPFVNLGVVPIAPAASIPYEYVDGFWDYCRNAEGKVFLNINNIESSFESRKAHLIERIIRISVIALFCSFATVLGILLYNDRAGNRRHKEKLEIAESK